MIAREGFVERLSPNSTIKGRVDFQPRRSQGIDNFGAGPSTFPVPPLAVVLVTFLEFPVDDVG